MQSVSSLSLFLFDGYYFIFAKDQNGKILAIRQQYFESSRLLAFKLKNEEFLSLDIPTKVFNHISSFSLVPGALFESSLSSIYLFYAEKPKENVSVFSTSLEGHSLHLVGSIQKDLAELLSEGKTDISFHHGASSFLYYALKEKTNFLSQEILVLIQNLSFYLLAFSNQDLVLFNRFEISSKEEFLNYLSGVIHQLNLNKLYCRISAYGETTQMGIDEVWGNKYFKNFKISTPVSNVQYREGTEIFQDSELFESYWILP